MSDQQRIQGLWRLVSRIHRGKPVQDSATHYLFSGDRQKEIVPSMVDEGKVRATFRLDEEADPKEIVVAMDWNGPDGPPASNPLIMRGFYRLSGDDLEMCFGIGSEFPSAFGDESGLLTLKRDYGAIPEGRRPSGIPPVEDDVLGVLTWDDNIHWYSGKVDCVGAPVDVNLCVDDNGSVTPALERARHVVRDIERYVRLAKALAAERLLDLANDWADQARERSRRSSPPNRAARRPRLVPLTANDFMSRIKLESMVFEADKGITFYHNDGDMFWGHCVQLCVDKDDECTGADIPG